MNIYFTSDHHFGHANILTFQDENKCYTRPNFKDVNEMNEFMIQRWNEHIKPTDRVYHLGDICIQDKMIDSLLPKLNGSKRLIVGNHDNIKKLAPHFKKVYLWRIFKDEQFVCTHMPLRLDQFRHKVILNVHGHLHQNVISDPHYFNVCVEQHDYKPIHIDEILAHIKSVFPPQ